MATRDIEVYEQKYKRVADGTTFCPYRVCPIGAHSDQNLGKITGLAINKGIRVAYGVKHNGVIEIESLQFDKRAQWHILDTPKEKQNDWADYLRGATIALSNRAQLHYGMSAVIDGELPIGGLSSSAAVIISFLLALCKVNNITLTAEEMIQTALEAEVNYVGVTIGTLDQSCEILSKKDQLLYLDTRDGSYELIPKHPDMKPYKIAVFFSGLERALVSSKYNLRVDESRAAAYSLKAFAGIEYGKFNQTNLREIPYETYLQYKDRLPVDFAKRAEHWYTEFQRVEKGAEAWRRGDIESYGQLSFESCNSSIHNWECGCPELIRLYEIMRETKGIYGGRFSGAGFKGCCMALIDPAYEEEILDGVGKAYLKTFPTLEGKYQSFICESADGVTL